MLIKNIHFFGYGPFQDIKIPLWSEDDADRKVTVLIGENGAGKSAFLEGIATLLSWFVARVRSEKSNGSYIDSLKIRDSNNFSALEVDVFASRKNFSWRVAKIVRGRRSKVESVLRETSLLASLYAEKLTMSEHASLPFIGYYPTERYVLDIPKLIRKRHTFNQIDGYETALTKGIDFRLFFEWFRDREDIQNELKISADEIFKYIDYSKIQEKMNVAENVFNIIDYDRVKAENPILFEKMQVAKNGYRDLQLLAVTRAIHAFMPDYTGLRIERKPRMRMLINKGR